MSTEFSCLVIFNLISTEFSCLVTFNLMSTEFSCLVTSKGKHSLSGLQLVRVAEWHGFVSNQGVGKVSLKAAKRPLGGRSHPIPIRRKGE
jgi:hypothetical protein